MDAIEKENQRSKTEAPRSKHSQWFFNKELFSAMLLAIFSAAAIIIANSPWAHHYEHWLHLEISILFGDLTISHSLLHWINDGLMTLFFFTVGLEIKREVLVGELADRKMAMLPVVAAAGGMIVPGLIYALLNMGQPGMAGWGIPVATDIAFSLGAIALLGSRLPVGLRIFLTAFAIADDLGAVIIIAVFYTQSISMGYLVASLTCIIVLLIANLLWIRWLPFYIFMGIATWICVMGSGVHATVAGVAVAMLVPARGKYNVSRFVSKIQAIINQMNVDKAIDRYWFSIFIKPEHVNSIHELSVACHDVETPLLRMEHALHPLVVYFILPLFAFFNAGLSLEGMSFFSAASHPVALGCILGLVVGKPAGIALASYWAVRAKIAALPENVKWPHIIGAGMLGGIGFTMSLFISGLSFTDASLLTFSKLGVLAGSGLSAIFGLLFLAFASIKKKAPYEEEAALTS